jgi:hypothetical protein
LVVANDAVAGLAIALVIGLSAARAVKIGLAFGIGTLALFAVSAFVFDSRVPPFIIHGLLGGAYIGLLSFGAMGGWFFSVSWIVLWLAGPGVAAALMTDRTAGTIGVVSGVIGVGYIWLQAHDDS